MLAQARMRGDPGIGAHAPVVLALVRRYEGSGPAHQDLVRAGAAGLRRGLAVLTRGEQGDPGSVLIAAALAQIRACVRASAAPARARADEAAVSAAIAQLEALRHRSPTIREIAAACGLQTDRVLDVVCARASRRLGS